MGEIHRRASGLGLWRTDAVVIFFAWVLFFGAVVPFTPMHEWIVLSLEICTISALVLIFLKVRMTAPRGATTYNLATVLGVSFPLLVTYFSELINRGDVPALALNIMIVALIYVWAMWILRLWEIREHLVGEWRVGCGLSAIGAALFTATWGYFTIGAWPMMPYWSYMMEKTPLYIGLALGFCGAYLIGTGQSHSRNLLPSALLLLSAVLVVAIFLVLPPFTLPALLMFLLLAYWERSTIRDAISAVTSAT